MSEEEKKAIERFKSKIKRADVDILKFSDVYTTLDIHNLRLLLNLIEKQEQELNKEKEKNKNIEDKIKGKINNLEIFRKTLPIRATEIERFIGELKDLLE